MEDGGVEGQTNGYVRGINMTIKKTCVALCLAFVVLPVALGGCAPQDQASTESVDGGVGAAVWSPEVDCGACHVKERASASDSACLYSLHADTACNTCHSSAKLETLHVKTKGEVPSELRATSVGSDACVSCHDVADIALKSNNSTTLADKNGRVVNPHDLPAVKDHEKIECASCHSMHAPADEGLLQARSAEKCVGCHHAEVYECGTCH